jgi:hypothetical protein
VNLISLFGIQKYIIYRIMQEGKWKYRPSCSACPANEVDMEAVSEV